ncbi:MAG: helix-turn-helix domain-containing protein [Bacteroidaceae bacterium]
MNHPIDKLHIYTLNVGFARHNGDWNWKNVRSPFSRLYLVMEGNARIVLPESTYDLSPGHLYFIPAFTTHSYVCNSLFSHYYIHIYENCHLEKGIIEDWDFPVEVKAADYDVELFRRLACINPFLKLPMSNPDAYDNHRTLMSNIDMNMRRPFCDKVESRGILFILLSRFFAAATPKVDTCDDRIRKVTEHIRHNICKTIDLQSLADMACMSKDHFIRIFKKRTGETPNNYIIKKKMEAAELLLITTNDTIKNIALVIGYEDCSYFVKTFKAFAGVTPTEYRQGRKNGEILTAPVRNPSGTR